MKNITQSVSAQKRLSRIVYHTLMVLSSFIMLYPVLWMIASSFKPNGDIFSLSLIHI